MYDNDAGHNIYKLTLYWIMQKYPIAISHGFRQVCQSFYGSVQNNIV